MVINGYEVVQLTNQYRLLDGHWYRDAWVRVGGRIELVTVLRALVDEA